MVVALSSLAVPSLGITCLSTVSAQLEKYKFLAGRPTVTNRRTMLTVQTQQALLSAFCAKSEEGGPAGDSPSCSD